MNDEESKTEEAPATPENDGVQPPADEEIKRLNEETERLNKAIAEKANAEARAKLGGVATSEPKPEPKEETAVEYKNRIEREIAEGKLR